MCACDNEAVFEYNRQQHKGKRPEHIWSKKNKKAWTTHLLFLHLQKGGFFGTSASYL